jgi:hypothetical protein
MFAVELQCSDCCSVLFVRACALGLECVMCRLFLQCSDCCPMLFVRACAPGYDCIMYSFIVVSNYTQLLGLHMPVIFVQLVSRGVNRLSGYVRT